MFQQSIIGLLRPNLKISDKHGHLPHLLEHLLVYPDRLERHGWRRRWHADRILYQNAHVNHDFEVEYAVVKRRYAEELLGILSSQAREYDFLPTEIEKERQVIREELAAGKTAELSLGEQFDRACLTHWPRRRGWDDRELAQPLLPEMMRRTARRLAHEFYPFVIDADRCDFGAAPLPCLAPNLFRDFGGRARWLRHPKMAEGRAAVWLLSPVEPEQIVDPAQHLFVQLLRNSYFGYLPHVLRDQEGLLYSLGVSQYLVTRSFEIHYMAASDQILPLARRLLDLIAGDDCAAWIKRQLPLARRNRLMLAELDWAQPSSFAGGYINAIVMSGDRQTTKAYNEQVRHLTVEDVLAARQKLLDNIDKFQLVVRRHGSKVASGWGKGL